MTQPSTQELLNVSGPYYGYFYYAQGSNGLWDARNGALLTKTGSAGMAVEGGANVVLGNGSTKYSLPSAMDIVTPWTLIVRARENTGQTTNSIVCGVDTTSTDFMWLNNGSTLFAARAGNTTTTASNTSPDTMATFAVVMSGITMSIYKNGTLVNSGTVSPAQDLKISTILTGYTGDSFSLQGSLEFLHAMPIACTSGEISSLYADPYQVLTAAAVTHATSGTLSAVGATLAGTATRNAGHVTHPTTGTLHGAGAALAGTSVHNAGSSIAITSPATCRMFQRGGGNTASIAITGTYTGSPTSIQAQFNGGTWATIVASPTGGTFSGTLTGCPVGQGTLSVRFGNSTGITGSVATIGVGDIYIVGGQSNNSGRATSVVAPTNTNFTAIELASDNVWKPLQESTVTGSSFDSQTGGVYSIRTGQTPQGSYFGALSNLMQSHGVPVAFVPCAMGSTGISAWAQPTTHTDTSQYYGVMLTRANLCGDHKAMLFWQGENDVSAGTTEVVYEAALNAIVNAWFADTGRQTVVQKICLSGNGDTTAVRTAEANVIASNGHVLAGCDMNVWTSGNVHFMSTTEINNVAAAAYTALSSIYTGSHATTGTLQGAGAAIASTASRVPTLSTGTDKLGLNTGLTRNSQAIACVTTINAAGAVIGTHTGLTTNSDGTFKLKEPSAVVGTSYIMVFDFADGGIAVTRRAAA